MELTLLTGCFAWSKGLPFFCELYVALNRGCAHSESASGLGLGHSAPNGSGDLLSEVYRVRFHRQMMHYRPTSLQHAVRSPGASLRTTFGGVDWERALTL